MEMVIALFFFLLYLLKLNRKLTFLFWPLVDIANSVFAALLLLIVCITAVASKNNKGTLTGAGFGFLIVVLCFVDAYLLFKMVTFNKPSTAEEKHQTL
nr:PREDICTED: chemokine-like factor [Latimeria chalumnae]|eukprot:XP_006004090.1 PREDICTED: chemokine-like factor [Latimeria chalumnae]